MRSCCRRSGRDSLSRSLLRHRGIWESGPRSDSSDGPSVVRSVTAAVAASLLWFLRRRPATVQVTVASLAPVVAVAAGVAGGSWAMFISGHDLRTLVVILVGAGTVGVITALLFGSRISQASAGLGELARRIGRDGTLDGRLTPGARGEPETDAGSRRARTARS